MSDSILSRVSGEVFSAWRFFQSSPPAAASFRTPMADARSSALSTTPSTAPIFSASPAPHCSPDAIHSIALSAPARRERRTVPPQPGKIPSFVSGRPTFVSAAITR